MAYGKGLKRSTPARVAHRLRATVHPRILAALATGPSNGIELEACPTLNQRGSGTCHAHSYVAARWVAQKANGKPLLWVPSPLALASVTYADMQRKGPTPADGWPVLQDTGAELQDDSDAGKRWGLAQIGPSPDGTLGDVPDTPEDNSFPEPDIEQLQQAGPNAGDAEYSIAIDSAVIDTAAATLDAKIPIRTAFYCDSAFEQLGPNDVAPAPNEADPKGGGHSTYLRAHKLVSGKRQFRLENSWGASWCDSGGVWVSEEWMRACWDLHPEPEYG